MALPLRKTVPVRLPQFTLARLPNETMQPPKRNDVSFLDLCIGSMSPGYKGPRVPSPSQPVRDAQRGKIAPPRTFAPQHPPPRGQQQPKLIFVTKPVVLARSLPPSDEHSSSNSSSSDSNSSDSDSDSEDCGPRKGNKKRHRPHSWRFDQEDGGNKRRAISLYAADEQPSPYVINARLARLDVPAPYTNPNEDFMDVDYPDRSPPSVRRSVVPGTRPIAPAAGRVQRTVLLGSIPPQQQLVPAGGVRSETGAATGTGTGAEELVVFTTVMTDLQKRALKADRMRAVRQIPEADTPPGITTPLMVHQRQALAWLLENPTRILGDDMGLGKTLTAIALISALVDRESSGGGGRWTKPTLIICPTNVVEHWLEQFGRYCPNLRVSAYDPSADQTDKHAVVVTIDKVAAEFRDSFGFASSQGGYGSATVTFDTHLPKTRLYRTKWFGIVLDEAHMIKNYMAMRAFACRLLSALLFRLAITGTPFQNNEQDPISLGAFLRLAPCLEDKRRREADGTTVVEKPPKATRAALALVSQNLLRRRKDDRLANGEPLINLPRLERIRRKCHPVSPQTALMAAIETVVKGQVRLVQQTTTNKRQVSNAALVAVTRLKQASLHPLLPLRAIGASTDELKRALAFASGTDTAPLYKLVEELFARHGNPDSPDTEDDTDGRQDTSKAPFLDEWCAQGVSCKMDLFIQDVREHLAKSPNAKIIVFSNFLQAVRIASVYITLAFGKDKQVFFHGGMSRLQRAAALAEFKEAGSPIQFFNATVQSGGLGLNLVEAELCVMLDSFWNPTVDQQAVDRIHRLGQSKIATVLFYDAADSVDQKILALQATKRGKAVEFLLDPDYCNGLDGDALPSNQKISMLSVLDL